MYLYFTYSGSDSVAHLVFFVFTFCWRSCNFGSVCESLLAAVTVIGAIVAGWWRTRLLVNFNASSDYSSNGVMKWRLDSWALSELWTILAQACWTILAVKKLKLECLNALMCHFLNKEPRKVILGSERVLLLLHPVLRVILILLWLLFLSLVFSLYFLLVVSIIASHDLLRRFFFLLFHVLRSIFRFFKAVFHFLRAVIWILTTN